MYKTVALLTQHAPIILKKLTFFIAITFITPTIVSSQSCLPWGIAFSTQAEIDSFQANYPNCTEIEGNVTISGSDITNLNELSAVTFFGGDLFIADNSALASLTGLDNVASVVGNLWIFSNSLTSLTGLDNVTTIGGDLIIFNNGTLTSLTGLDKVTSVGGNFRIAVSSALTSLTGLDNMTSIGRDIDIYRNDVLTSLTGLDNVASIGKNLWIIDNALLSTCEIRSICDYLINPNGDISISGNYPGCNSQEEVEQACAAAGFSCLPEGISFSTQAEIDSFQANYPNCTEIEGNVSISGSDITNINGLSVVTSIGGDLLIEENGALTTLTGLDNVTTIGDLWIYNNDALTSLTGLDNVTTIGGLWIYNNDAVTSLTGLDNVAAIGEYLGIDDNDALTSLTGLDNLTSIGGLWIYNNDALTSLTGLDNVTSNIIDLEIDNNGALTSLTGLENVTSILGNLWIQNNALLSTCEVRCICDYLTIPPRGEIHNNNTGCNNLEEVEEACAPDGVTDAKGGFEFSIYPNPARGEIYISAGNGKVINEVNIYNQMGQKVFARQLTNTVDISKLPAGSYIIELVSNKSKMCEKVIVLD